MYYQTNFGRFIYLLLTIIKVAQVASIEKEVCSKEISKSPTTWPERERRVQMQAPSPEGFTSQVIT